MTRRLPFQKLLHRGVREGATPFPGLLHFSLDPYLIMLSVKQGSIKCHFFESLVRLDLGLNLSLPDDKRMNIIRKKRIAFKILESMRRSGCYIVHYLVKHVLMDNTSYCEVCFFFNIKKKFHESRQGYLKATSHLRSFLRLFLRESGTFQAFLYFST